MLRYIYRVVVVFFLFLFLLLFAEGFITLFSMYLGFNAPLIVRSSTDSSIPWSPFGDTTGKGEGLAASVLLRGSHLDGNNNTEEENRPITRLFISPINLTKPSLLYSSFIYPRSADYHYGLTARCAPCS